MGMRRAKAGYLMCEWGCKDWVVQGDKQFEHETELCLSRVMRCRLKCALKLKAEQWLDARKPHEENDCPKRIVPCDYDCGM